MSTTRKTKAIILDGKLLKHGDEIMVKWGGETTEYPAILHIQDGTRCFALQDQRNGSTPNNFYGNPSVNKGKTFSWVFVPGDVFDDFKVNTQKAGIDVPALKKVKTETKTSLKMNGSRMELIVYKERVYDKGEEDVTSQYNVVYDGRISKSRVSNSAGKQTHTLFVRNSHPDCCGAHILYGFSAAREGDEMYQPYQYLTDKDLAEVKRQAGLGQGASKLAHLADYQHHAIKFVERIGFKKIHEFKNRNSGNIVSLYQYD